MDNTPLQNQIELAVTGRRNRDKLPRHSYIGSSKHSVLFRRGHTDYDSQFGLSFELLNWDMEDSGKHSGFKVPSQGQLGSFYNNLMNVIERSSLDEVCDIIRLTYFPEDFPEISKRVR